MMSIDKMGVEVVGTNLIMMLHDVSMHNDVQSVETTFYGSEPFEHEWYGGKITYPGTFQMDLVINVLHHGDFSGIRQIVHDYGFSWAKQYNDKCKHVNKVKLEGINLK